MRLELQRFSRRLDRHNIMSVGLFFCSVLICSTLFGCGPLALHRLQTHAEKGDYEWIAARKIDCRHQSLSCSEQHRIRAEACLQLAGAGHDSIANHICAADELDAAILTLPSTKDDHSEASALLHERVCEVLLALHGEQRGAEADKTIDRLTTAADRLYQLRPASLAATYYHCQARLKQMEPALKGINEAKRLPVCNRLKRILTRALYRMETASRQPGADWDRFREKYKRLVFEIGVALRATACH